MLSLACPVLKPDKVTEELIKGTPLKPKKIMPDVENSLPGLYGADEDPLENTQITFKTNNPPVGIQNQLEELEDTIPEDNSSPDNTIPDERNRHVIDDDDDACIPPPPPYIAETNPNWKPGRPLEPEHHIPTQALNGVFDYDQEIITTVREQTITYLEELNYHPEDVKLGELPVDQVKFAELENSLLAAENLDDEFVLEKKESDLMNLYVKANKINSNVGKRSKKATTVNDYSRRLFSSVNISNL